MNPMKWIKKNWSWLHPLCWIGGFLSVNWLFAHFASFPELNRWIVAILAFGIYVIIARPIVKRGGSQQLETGLVAVCGMAFLLHLAWVFLVPMMAEEEAASLPCATQSLELQCYTFSQENCSVVWDHFAKDCTDEVKRTIISRRSTALTGPIVRKCIYKKLDQSFRTNRRTPTNEACEKLFSSLDAPSL
jgi:hypothetical protein